MTGISLKQQLEKKNLRCSKARSLCFWGYVVCWGIQYTLQGEKPRVDEAGEAEMFFSQDKPELLSVLSRSAERSLKRLNEIRRKANRRKQSGV